MLTLNPDIHSVTAFAPATSANVAVGFDILGFAIENVGDQVTLTKRHDNKIIITEITGLESLPLDVNKNTATAVIKKLSHDFNLDTGFSVAIKKGIPLSSGMGGSAASAVAALVACNAFLNNALTKQQLAEFALFGEEVACGQAHGDNIIPCLFGGMTLIASQNPLTIIELPIPDVYCVIVHPHLQVTTKEARQALAKDLPLQNFVKQSANLAAFIAALYRGDLALLQTSLQDNVIEPQRAHFIPGFYTIKDAALKAGALAMSLSGSGPSLFAFTKTCETANDVIAAMQNALRRENIASSYWLSRIAPTAAHVINQT